MGQCAPSPPAALGKPLGAEQVCTAKQKSGIAHGCSGGIQERGTHGSAVTGSNSLPKLRLRIVSRGASTYIAKSMPETTES